MSFNNYIDVINYVLHQIKQEENPSCLICVDNVFTTNDSILIIFKYQFIKKNRNVILNCFINNYNNIKNIDQNINILINDISNILQIKPDI